MVAGMVMPLDNLRAIYERLFRDGVMVAKKDKRPQTKHPEIPGVGNLQVIRAMGSLKSRGFVRETFAWRHFYWYLTNEGIVYLRDYLHLPPEIVPTPLQRVRRPAATLAIVQRAARVQAIEGPTSYVPKPGRGGTESQEALLQRQEYRRKQIGTEVERLPSEKTPRFRGRPIIDEIKPNASWSRDQAQPSPSSGQDYAREMDRRVGRKAVTEVYHQPPAEMRSAQSLIRKTMTTEEYKGSSEAALIKNKPKTTVSVDLPTQSAVTAITTGTVAASMSLKKAEKEKLKEEVSVKVSQEIITSKSTRDVFLPSVTQVKATETKNVQEYPVKDEMPKVTDTTARVTEKILKSVTQEKITSEDCNTGDKKALIECLPKTVAQLTDTATTADRVTVTASMCPSKAGKEKVKEEVSVKVSQEIITSKSAKDVSLPSKKQLAKTVKPRDTETKNVQDYPVSNEMPKVTEKISMSVMQKMTSEDCNRSDEIALVENLPKTTAQLDITATTADTVAVTPSGSPSKAGKEKLIEEVSAKVSQLASTTEQTKDTSLTPFTKKVKKTPKVTNVKEDPVKDEMPKMAEKVPMSVTEKTTAVSVDLPAQHTSDMVTVTASMSPNKTGKEKLKDKVSVNVSQETEQASDATQHASSKKNMEKTMKAIVTTNVQEHPVKHEMPRVAEEVSMSFTEKTTAASVDLPAQLTSDMVTVTTSMSPSKAGKDRVSVKVSQEKDTKEQASNATESASSKKKVGKLVKATVTTNVQEHPVKDEKLRVTEEVSTSVMQKKMTLVDFSKSSEMGTLENVPETAVIVDMPATTAQTIAVTASMSPSRSDQQKLEEVSGKVSQEANVKEQAKDTSQPLFSKKKKEKMQKTAATKNIQEHSVKNEMPSLAEKLPMSLISKSAVHPVELESEAKSAAELNLEKGENIKGIKDKDDSIRSSASAVPPVSKKNEDTALLNIVVDTVKEKAEINLAQQTAEPSLEENASNVASVGPPMVTLAVAKSSAQKSKKKKAQKTSSTEETKDNDNPKNSKPVLLSAPKEVDIPADETCTTVVKTEVKMHKHDPSPTSEISAASADAHAKEIITHEEIKVVQQRTATKESKTEVSKQEITSDQQKPPPAKPTEESKATAPNNEEAEDAPKSRKKGKKKTKAAVNLSPDLSPTAEIKAAEVMTAQAAIKVHPTQSPETLVAIVSPKIPPEGMCTKESQAGAVQAEAPAHKGEAESAQPSAEKIKREVLKEKTSSSQILREAPTGQASAAASAQAGPHPEQGEPPSVAQLSAAPDTQHRGEKQKELSVSKAIELPLTTGPFSTQEIICDTQALPEDETTMRRKIVVVEEVIEVQQIASPGAGGSPPAATPVPEIEGDDLDYDVLEELARERAVLQGTPVQEISWDHSLDEPEAKTFPNFIEDERDRVQKKTFTKWVNKHLIKAQRHVSDLYEDLRDGHNLISLLEVLSGETLPREKGRMRFHKLQNVQIALDFLKHRQVKLVNIRNDDIADGNPKLTLGLIWTIILHFQISDIQVNGQSDDMSAKEKLLLWSQRMVEGYQGLRCDNFTTSWRDGKLFNAVIHRHE
ncbi:hypothetical protein MHYP_G00025960 [Metynnis hypsauchen]